MIIGQLPSSSSAALTDYVPTEKSGSTLKATLTQILSLFKSNTAVSDLSGTLAVAHGGTGGTTAAAAKENLKLRYALGRDTTSGGTRDISITPYQSAEGYAFLVVTVNWATTANNASLYLVNGIQNGAYQTINELFKGTQNAGVVTLKNSTTITVTWPAAYGFVTIIPLLA